MTFELLKTILFAVNEIWLRPVIGIHPPVNPAPRGAPIPPGVVALGLLPQPESRARVDSANTAAAFFFIHWFFIFSSTTHSISTVVAYAPLRSTPLCLR